MIKELINIYFLGESCTTNLNVNGHCVVLVECKILVQLLKKGGIKNHEILRANAASCGNKWSEKKPVVCCKMTVTIRLTAITENCGISQGNHDRVVGGKDAEKGAWPWMALLFYINPIDEVEKGCGGTVISKRHVLTGSIKKINFYSIFSIFHHVIQFFQLPIAQINVICKK